MRVILLGILAPVLVIAAAAESLKQDNPIGNEIYEIRIYETAPPGTKATLNEAFDRVMREQNNCFAQLETAWDTDWIEFDSSLLMFITTADVPTTARTTQQAVLHLMCASNKMRSIHFSIHITRRNRHSPKFVADSLVFYAPATLQPGAELGALQVIDNDPIIYNSQIQLNILPSAIKIGAISGGGASRVPSLDMKSSNEVESHWLVLKNGSLVVNKPMTDLQLYRPYVIRVLAVDFGSPQLFSICNVTIVPVSVSQPQNVRVNVANTEYQVFEWNAPAFGIPEKYHIAIRRHGAMLRSQEVEANSNIILSRERFSSGPDYTVTVTAVDVDGSSPSEPYPFIMIRTELSCEGECAPGGGVPLCYYGQFHKIEQYRDESGPHCLCYDGFSSPQCDIIESCPGERLLEPYGGVDWPFTPVNQSSSILCPYNANDEIVMRKCTWDTRLQMARWQNISNNEICKKQSSILVHLGVLANYAQRADQTASGLRAVQRFLATVLRMPAFRPQVTSAHFDAKIAEHIAQVLDTMMAVNLSAIAGNTSDVRADIVDYMLELTRRIPVPFHLQSAGSGFQIRTWHWLGSPSLKSDLSDNAASIPIGDEIPVQFGQRCYIHLPAGRRQRGGALIVHGYSQRAQIVRVACLRPTTILPLLEGRSPVLFVTADTDEEMKDGEGIEKGNVNEDRSVEVKNGKITVVKISDVNRYGPTISRQKIAGGAKVLIALRPEPLTSGHGALFRYGDADINYTCAIYDHSKYGWSITGITVLSRNFEDGFVLCESTHLGLFALLSESMFKAKHVSLLEILITILPIATTSFAALCTVFLLFIAVLQRPQCPDPALILFLLTFFTLHLLHLFLMIGPLITDETTLAANDRPAYLCLQYILISIAALLMLLGAATHARIADLEAGVRRVVSMCCRLISSVVLGVGIPVLMCITAWLFNGHIYENVTSTDPYLRSFNWIFAVNFALPLAVFTGSATGYACYAYYYAQLTLKTPASVTILASSSPYSTAVADSGRQRLIRDLANASLFMLAIMALIFVSVITFFHVNRPQRNVLLAVLHLCLAAVVFIFTGLLYRIELKFPRYTRGNHINEVRRLFANGTTDQTFFHDSGKSNGNARVSGTAPLIFNADESDSTNTNIPTLSTPFKNGLSADVYINNECLANSGTISPKGANMVGSITYEGRKCNYFTYDASHGRCSSSANYVTQLNVPTVLAGHEEDDDDSGRLTLNSPAPSSLQNATETFRIRDIAADANELPNSDLGTETSYNRNGYGNSVSDRGEYAGVSHSSQCSSNQGKSYTERHDSMQYDRILSPTLPLREKNQSLYADNLADTVDSTCTTNRICRTMALQKQMVSDSMVPPQATKMSLLKLNFLYGKEMDALATSQTTVQIVSDVKHRQSITDSNELITSSSHSSPNDNTLIKTSYNEVKIGFEDESNGHPIVSVV